VKYSRKTKAFSLIELMISISIVAILAATAIPSYLNYLQRATLSEALGVLTEYKIALGVFWSTEGTLPASGDTLISTPADLPFGVTVTANLPKSISSIRLYNSGNGVLVTAVVNANIFATFAANNRTMVLGAKPQGHEITFECGNFALDAASTSDIGFTDMSLLPKGCNYNGVGPWLAI
jgi:prepilin-type N-terminal cleavage/methylation domain-containing protein